MVCTLTTPTKPSTQTSFTKYCFALLVVVKRSFTCFLVFYSFFFETLTLQCVCVSLVPCTFLDVSKNMPGVLYPPRVTFQISWGIRLRCCRCNSSFIDYDVSLLSFVTNV